MVLVVVSLNGRLRTRLRDDTASELLRDAHLVGGMWRRDLDADSLANATGAALGRRVTLIGPDGTVLGDSEFSPAEITALQNHATRPEVMAAVATGQGTALRMSPSEGDAELYAAVRTPNGVARVSASTRALDDVVSRVQRDVLGAAGLATIVAVLLAAVFARSVARPILELRDDARAIAGGDLSRRPTLAAPGEVGELATAFHRLADELGTRLVALEADDALLRALTESLNEGVVAIDEQLRVVHMNENARRLLGARSTVPFPADELPRERTLREAVAAARRGLSSDGLEIQLGDRTIALTVRPLAKGGAVLALFDLTTIRRLESVRRDFVANVSHELKTPLTVVGGFAETLLDEELPPADRRQFAEKIAGNTRRMQRLVDDLLDLSRIESGGWKPNPVRVDLRSVASELLAAASDRVQGRQIALLDEIPDDASGVYADPTALRQVLGNLVDNAVRHTSEGCIVLFSRRDSRGTLVGVRDTGTGIAPEHLPRLFERFYRVDAARSRNEGGTGLGLAIVKHLVEAHGGYVVAESRPTAGTTVSAWFPDSRSLE